MHFSMPCDTLYLTKSTKPELAIHLMQRIHQARVPVKWVACDTVYGSQQDVRDCLKTHQYWYVGAVPCNESVVVQTSLGVRRMEVRNATYLGKNLFSTR
jgi:SRSO17 transposase